MGLEWRLAWRNVWRNPRRTGLTVAATVFAVLLVILSVALSTGMHDKMVEDSVRVHSGHLTLAAPDYLEERSLEQSLQLDAALARELEATPEVRGWAPRVTSFALVSKQSESQGALVLGVDPEREKSVTTLAERVKRGRFVSGESREIVLGELLAQNLGVEIGDEVLLFGVAYSLESAYELFRVVGTLRLPEPQLERSLAVVSLVDAAEFFVMGDRVSEIALLAANAGRTQQLRAALSATLADRGILAHTWQEVMPELDVFILLDDAAMYLTLAILVVVVAFGILNTVLMAVLERKRELGVVLALGLRPGSVLRVVYLESLMLAAVGLAIGAALAIPIALYFQHNPVEVGGDFAELGKFFGFEMLILTRLETSNLVGSSLTILGVAAIAAFYPALKASRSRPVEALRSL